MWKIECPQCHHLFSVVTEENMELIEDEKGEDIKENPREKVEDALETLVPFSRRVPGSFGTEVNVDYLTYEYKFKCKHCGNEWTELKEKERVTKG
jgi:Zn finger protein HypA/HybF involved in hydrogenase expression